METTTNTLVEAHTRHPMKLVEGFRGVSKRLVYEYRGHRIIQTLRSYDVRNKTHNGYDWSVELADGTRAWAYSRQDAKARINARVGA